MAGCVNDDGVQIDQALHGYAGGHRLIASSSKLHEADARTMLVLSDASTVRFSDPTHGILTGYPLTKSSKYVLARTWPAPEMPRPGCVWTHSLLIGFADLATISNVLSLLGLFRRPNSQPNGYDVSLRAEGVRHLPEGLDDPRAPGLLNALYLEPISKVELSVSHPVADEALILAAWMQQWPRLRRAFRFCSLVGADRSISSDAFDLQMTTALSPGTGPTIPDAQLAGGGPVDSSLNEAACDLRRPGDLRAFLRLVGGDVPRGRAAMAPLCRLHDTLERADRGQMSYGVALDALEALGVNQARAARRLVADHAIANIANVDDRTFQFILDDALAAESEPDAPIVDTVGDALWKRSPTEFVAALEDQGRLGFVANRAVRTLPVGSLAERVEQEPDIALRISLARPDVTQHSAFWRNRLVDVAAILAQMDAPSPAVLGAILSAGRADAVRVVIHRFGVSETLVAVNARLHDETIDLRAWLDALVADPTILAGVLATGKLSRPLVVSFSRRVRPDDVPNDYGDDPWVIAAHAAGSVSSTDEAIFSAFLMARALGRRSRSKAALFQMAFGRVHASLADGSMPYDGWSIINQMLPWPLPWGEWDRCARLKEAVVESFIDNELDPATFGWITPSQSAFEDMARIAARGRSGRAFLERVRKSIQNQSEPSIQARSKLLKKLI